jgi:V/A-type H+-transporting ATPase subunit I
MFGDVGHGLILLVGGLTLGILIKKNQAIKNLCWIIAACGASAIIMGLLYGEFFGNDKLFKPIWFSPFNNVFDFLIFSLLMGVIQITSGLVLEMVNFLLKHNVVDAVLTSAPKIAFYVGAVYLIAVYQLNLGVWFSGPILLIIAPFLVLVFAKTIFLTIGEFSQGSIENQNKKGEGNSLGERIFESGDQVTRLLSNTISYARILALLMAHWALLLVTYTIAGQIGYASIPALIISGIIIVGGNIFVLALEGLIVFIHSLRLHFYEWFSKFYQDCGTEFKAFKQNFVHTKVFFKEKPQVTGES